MAKFMELNSFQNYILAVKIVLGFLLQRSIGRRRNSAIQRIVNFYRFAKMLLKARELHLSKIRLKNISTLK